MIKVMCIENNPSNCPPTEKVGEVFYLDQNTIFGDDNGDWYGKMWKMDESMEFIEQGTRLLRRFKRIK